MTIIIADGYQEDGGLIGVPDVGRSEEYPTTHARILHAGGWASGGTVSASSTATGYYADGPQSNTTYKKWGVDTFPATWVETYPEYTGFVDCCAIAAHNLGTVGADIDVEYYDGTAWQSVASGSIEDDSPIMVLFDPVQSAQWRISISGVGETLIDGDGEEVTDSDGELLLSSGDASTAIIGVIRFGKAMQMPRAVYQGYTPSQGNRNTTKTTNESARGEFLGSITLRTSLNSSVSWSLLAAQWVRDEWVPFMIEAENNPFFVAWRPASFGEVDFVISSDFQPPTNTGPRAYMNAGFSGTAYGWE